jgi:transcriptional regulator with XRE-family HTH domain
MASGADPGADERQKLGAFLRARRGHLDPQVAGLDGAGRRRVPGLRREEVAQLAMISTDYYTRLEQGRIASASESVLDALANALRLNQDERSYLYRLANKGDEPYPWPRDTEAVRPQVRRLLENLRDIPALVLSRFLDILAWNASRRPSLRTLRPSGARNGTSCGCSSSTQTSAAASSTGDRHGRRSASSAPLAHTNLGSRT